MTKELMMEYKTLLKQGLHEYKKAVMSGEDDLASFWMEEVVDILDTIFPTDVNKEKSIQ